MKISNPKILLLAPPNSIHTIKWANELVKKGFNIYLFGFDASKNEKYHNLVRHETFSVPNWIISRGFGSFIKIYYLLSIPKIYKILKKIQPNIIHSHYASSYGILGAFTTFHPIVVSVWGSDVFSFPDQSFLHKIVLKFVLNRADYILSTSQFMMQRTKEFTSKEIRVTPFGVDLDIFCKNKKNQYDEIVIGTTKGLEKQYGIEFLIKAFARLVNKYSDIKLKLLIIGDGSLRKEMEKLTADLKISSFVNFTGFVSNEKIPEYLNTIDIYVAVSIYDDESFGVAIVEAQACEIPVVVSDAGGLSEVISNGVTGFVVPKMDSIKTADAIDKLICDKNLRESFGRAGRERMEKLFEINSTVNNMVDIYKMILEEKGQ